MSFYLDRLIHKESKVFDAGDVLESASDFMNDWLVDHAEETDSGRQVCVTIELVPTQEERQEAADDDFFDDEYN